MAKKHAGGGHKKHGRNQRKQANRGGATSLFVRGKISAEIYFKMTGQSLKRTV